MPNNVQLLPGAVHSLLIAPESFNYKVEFTLGGVKEKYSFVCDKNNRYVRVLKDREQNKALFQVYFDNPCDPQCLGANAYYCVSEVTYAVSPDGNLLATYDVYDPYVKLWNLKTGKRIALLNAEGFEISFSSDGKLLQTRGSTAVLTWDVNKITHN
jgi:WD40 repeat protein